jgi:hypothetical protein
MPGVIQSTLTALHRRAMTSALLPGLVRNGSSNGTAGGHTPTALSRWSILSRPLPAVEQIKHLHVYDFDNTRESAMNIVLPGVISHVIDTPSCAVFKTPLPNPKLWHGTTIGMLASADVFVNGGWWHDSRILAATGGGIAKEEPRAWAGWWNETVVELVQLTMKQQDALCILLTGRSESGFGELVKRMTTSKGLEFDLMTLKPAVGPGNERFASTMQFKQQFLTSLMETYKHAEEIRIYEDRPKHVKGFRDFMELYNDRLHEAQLTGIPARPPISAEVVQVAEMATSLDPVTEVAEVQHLVNAHNEALVKRPQGLRGERLIIKRTVFYTGYLIENADTQRLLTLVQLPGNLADAELKIHANNILICARPCPFSILKKVGGMGAKMRWQVVGTACYDDSVWAASVRPVDANAKFHSDNPSPFVVLALRKGARPHDAGKIRNWQPVPPEKAYVFDTTVGERMSLQIEPENPSAGDYESLFPNQAAKRRFTGHNDSSQHRPPAGPQGQTRGYHHSSHMGRGGSNQGRGGRGAPNRGFRGRGGGQGRGGRGGRGKHQYHSLDDVGPREPQGGFAQQVSYDDTSYQPPKQPAAFQQANAQPSQQGFNGWPPPGLPAQPRPQGRPRGGGGQGYGGPELQNYY